MKMISGSILILTAEQAFAHSQSIPFPNQVFANEVLYPSSMVLAGLGLILMLWGAITDFPKQKTGGQ